MYCGFKLDGFVYFRNEVNLHNMPWAVFNVLATFLSEADIQALSLVCKSLRYIAVSTYSQICVPCGENFSAICTMAAIKSFTLFGYYANTAQVVRSLQSLLYLLKSGKMLWLKKCELKGIEIPVAKILEEIMGYVELRTLVLTDCPPIEFKFMNSIVQNNKTLRFVSARINLNASVDVRKFAELLNLTIGKITFGHQVIDAIPAELLIYPRESYSTPFPVGL